MIKRLERQPVFILDLLDVIYLTLLANLSFSSFKQTLNIGAMTPQ